MSLKYFLYLCVLQMKSGNKVEWLESHPRVCFVVVVVVEWGKKY